MRPRTQERVEQGPDEKLFKQKLRMSNLRTGLGSFQGVKIGIISHLHLLYDSERQRNLVSIKESGTNIHTLAWDRLSRQDVEQKLPARDPTAIPRWCRDGRNTAPSGRIDITGQKTTVRINGGGLRENYKSPPYDRGSRT